MQSEALDISTENCLVEKTGHVMVVTLNRPEAKNALNGAMLVGLYRAWRRLDADDDLYCAILTGTGDTFCAGMDLKTGPGGDNSGDIQAMMKEIPDLHWQALLRHQQPRKPVILAVEGYALAGGTEILQGTDCGWPPRMRSSALPNASAACFPWVVRPSACAGRFPTRWLPRFCSLAAMCRLRKHCSGD